MISYRDMTFCKHYKDCKHKGECRRPLTPKVVKEAHEWWGSEEAPISVFSNKPECWEKGEK